MVKKSWKSINFISNSLRKIKKPEFFQQFVCDVSLLMTKHKLNDIFCSHTSVNQPAAQREREGNLCPAGYDLPFSMKEI